MQFFEKIFHNFWENIAKYIRNFAVAVKRISFKTKCFAIYSGKLIIEVWVRYLLAGSAGLAGKILGYHSSPTQTPTNYWQWKTEFGIRLDTSDSDRDLPLPVPINYIAIICNLWYALCILVGISDFILVEIICTNQSEAKVLEKWNYLGLGSFHFWFFPC